MPVTYRSPQAGHGDEVIWKGEPIADEHPFYLGMRATAPWKDAARRLGVRGAAGAAVTEEWQANTLLTSM